MSFRPWYKYNNNEINLQELSQRVKLDEISYCLNRSSSYKCHVRRLVDELNLWESFDEAAEEISKYNCESFFIDEFGHWNPAEAEIKITEHRQWVLLEEEDLDKIGWPDIKYCPGWPLFIDSQDDDYEPLLNKNQCFNYCRQLTVPNTIKDFHYFLGLKLMFIAYDINSVKTFLEHHYANTFNSNMEQFANCLLMAFSLSKHTLDLNLEVQSFVKNWIDLKIKLASQSGLNNSQVNGTNQVIASSHNQNGAHISSSNGLPVGKLYLGGSIPMNTLETENPSEITIKGMFGDKAAEFKDEFIKYAKTRQIKGRHTATNTFQNVVSYLIKHGNEFPDDLKALAHAFHKEFRWILFNNISDPDSLKKNLTHQDIDEFEATAELNNIFSPYLY